MTEIDYVISHLTSVRRKRHRTNVGRGVLASMRLDFVESIVMSVIGDERSSAMTAMCDDREIGYEKWPDITMIDIAVEMQSRKKNSVLVTGLHTV